MKKIFLFMTLVFCTDTLLGMETKNSSTKAEKNKARREKFFDACEKGDLEEVNRLLREKEDLIDATRAGEPGLLIAAKNGRSNVVKELLERLKQLHEDDQKEFTREINKLYVNGSALSYAVLSKSIETVNTLLEYGVEYMSLLLKFILYRNIEELKILLVCKIDVNAKTKEGETPLLYAIASTTPDKKEEMFQIIKLLCQNGADVNLPGKYRVSHLLGVQANKPEITPLMLAAKSQLINIARLLLEHKADVNVVDSEGNTALFYAIVLEAITFQDVIDLVTFLLKNGARVDIRNKKGQSPLDFAQSKLEESKKAEETLREQLEQEKKRKAAGYKIDNPIELSRFQDLYEIQVYYEKIILLLKNQKPNQELINKLQSALEKLTLRLIDLRNTLKTYS